MTDDAIVNTDRISMLRNCSALNQGASSMAGRRRASMKDIASLSLAR